MNQAGEEEHPRVVVNADPLAVVKVRRCRSCGKKAPWCSCGKADYADDESGSSEA